MVKDELTLDLCFTDAPKHFSSLFGKSELFLHLQL